MSSSSVKRPIFALHLFCFILWGHEESVKPLAVPCCYCQNDNQTFTCPLFNKMSMALKFHWSQNVMFLPTLMLIF